MPKKIVLLMTSLIFFFGFNLAFAGVVINEIMYAPPNGSAHEWLEIYNPGSESVDLTDWRFFNSQTDSAPLRVQMGPPVLSAGGYAIITKTLDGFISDWPAFTGTIFTSSQFSLPDDSTANGTYKAISNPDKQIIDSITYDTSKGGNKDSGNSLSKINDTWSEGTPTPGAVNIAATSNNNDNTDTVSGTATTDTSSGNNTSATTNTGASSSGGSGGGGGGSSASIKKATNQKIKVNITSKTLAFVGLPITLEGTAFGHFGEQLHNGKYFWNFGDGDSKEVFVNESQKFTHVYHYWGEYAVSLEYYENKVEGAAAASDKITIKVIPSDISISAVGDEKDFFVELSNNTAYDADVSNWILSSSGKSFTLPRNTIIGSKKKIIISSTITNFSIQDKNTLKLMSPEGNIVSDYGAATARSVIPVSAQISLNSSRVDSALGKKEPAKTVAENQPSKTDVPPQTLIPSLSSLGVSKESLLAGPALSADALASDISSNNTKNANSDGTANPFSIIIFVVSIIFIGASAYAVYFIRRKNSIALAGSDFEILDE